MSQVFFTSDEHYGHKNINMLAERPFRDVVEMREGLIERFNSRVTQRDLTYHLGDFSMSVKEMGPIVRRLNGRHVLVAGNHDECHPMHKKHAVATERYLAAGFLSVMPSLRLPADRDLLLLHHMPYVSDSRHDGKYTQWLPPDRGGWLLHGHVHGSWRVRDRMINVGVDVWGYYPVSYDEILAVRTNAEAKVARGPE